MRFDKIVELMLAHQLIQAPIQRLAGGRWQVRRRDPHGRLQTTGPASLPVVRTPAAGNHVIITDAPLIAVADAGVRLDVSKEATMQLETAPNDPPLATSVMTSLWQADLISILTERTVGWDATGAGTQYFDLVAA